MLTLIFYWLALFLIIYSIGHLIIKKNFEWYEYFWIGLVVVFAILQVWSIFLPVNVYSLLFISLLSFISFIKILRDGFKLPKINLWLLFFVGFGLLVISYYASQPVGWDDTLLYHLNAVKWASLYPAVPGLANLHSRLGFNSSFFLFASMLNNGFMVNRVSHLALSFLVAVLFVEFVYILIKSKSRSLKLFCLFVSPLIFIDVAKYQIVASLSPDFALLILILAIAVEFIKGDPKSLIIAGVLSTLVFTIKLSAAPFSILIIGYVIYRIFNENKNTRSKLFGTLSGSSLFLVIPFLIRNIILSGWLLYPLPMFKINTSWTVPYSQVKGLYTVIQTWAKVPGTEWTKFVNADFWRWFPIWYSANAGSIEVKIFGFSFLALLLLPLIGIFKTRTTENKFPLLVLSFISLISIFYVFFTAPDIRFGGVYIWIFFASIISFYFGVLKWSLNTKIITSIVAMIFLLFVSWPIRFDNEPILKSVRWDPAWPTKSINGVLMPTEQNLCGNSDLPCTPETNNIHEISPGDISKGFAPN